MTEHTDKRDRVAEVLLDCIGYWEGMLIDPRKPGSLHIVNAKLSEPNLIEVKISDGTVYTARVCQKRNTAY